EMVIASGLRSARRQKSRLPQRTRPVRDDFQRDSPQRTRKGRGVFQSDSWQTTQKSQREDRDAVTGDEERFTGLDMGMRRGWRVWHAAIVTPVLALIASSIGLAWAIAGEIRPERDDRRGSASSGPIEFREGLALKLTGQPRRAPINMDPIAAQVAAGTW